MDLRALVFMPALAGCAICGFVFALFAAHYYLNVMQTTAAGARRVTWASEPILDHFGKMFYLLWLVGLSLGPAWLVARAVGRGSEAAWVRTAAPLAVVWLCYPVSQLSSLGGPTVWLPLYPPVLRRLARKPGAVVGFLLLSGLVLAGLWLALDRTFLAADLVWLFLGSPLLVLSALLYARLVGRLAFAIAFEVVPAGRKRKKRGGKKRVVAEADVEPDGGFTQPRDLPPVMTPDEGPLVGYDVRLDDAPKPRKRVVAEVAGAEEKAADAPPPRYTDAWDRDDEDASPYAVGAAEVKDDARAPAELVRPSEYEMKLLDRGDAPKPPKRVWTAEVLAFLGQPETLAPVLTLSALCVAFGGMVRIARAFNPVGDGP